MAGCENTDEAVSLQVLTLEQVPVEKRHGIHTNAALPFHNDMGCEVLTLLYREVAASGGATSLASAAAIYNDLLKQPEILETLKAADWPVQLSVKTPRFEKMPLLAYYEGHVISEFYDSLRYCYRNIISLTFSQSLLTPVVLAFTPRPPRSPPRAPGLPKHSCKPSRS